MTVKAQLSDRTGTVGAVNSLQEGPGFRFADWPSDQVPRRAAGVYTVWRGDEFIYVGMSGRGAEAEDFVVSGGSGKAMGLWTRLNSHASGRRSGDQFNIYVCDRFIVPVLTSDEQQQIGSGRLLLGQLTRRWHRLKNAPAHRRSASPVPPKASSRRTHERMPNCSMTAPRDSAKSQLAAGIVYSSPTGFVAAVLLDLFS